jgi:6-phosphogluconate dehydrogenase
MKLGMIGLGRMGANMVRRLLRAGHTCVVYDIHPEAAQSLVKEGAKGATSLGDFVGQLTPPRDVWMMVPSAAVDPTLAALVPLLDREDTVIDGGNSYYHDDLRRAAELKGKGIYYVVSVAEGGSLDGEFRVVASTLGPP